MAVVMNMQCESHCRCGCSSQSRGGVEKCQGGLAGAECDRVCCRKHSFRSQCVSRRRTQGRVYPACQLLQDAPRKVSTYALPSSYQITSRFGQAGTSTGAPVAEQFVLLDARAGNIRLTPIPLPKGALRVLLVCVSCAVESDSCSVVQALSGYKPNQARTN
jgi:hypothetical protein